MKVRFGGTPKPARGTRALPGVRVLAFLWIVALLTVSVFSADDKDKPADDLTAKSLPFRTALFHDPTLAPPLERLLALYREGGRAKELVDLYRQHVAQYPADIGSLTVLIRLLAATDDPEAGSVARKAAERLPDNAFLQFLLFEHLQKAREAGALNALDRAITKETLPARKRAWIEQLLPLATAEGRPELAQKHLETLAAQSRTAEEKVEVARKMIAQKLEVAALAVLDSAAAQAPAAETGVEIDLAAASAEVGLKKTDAAATRLDRLLGRLAADYWRRAEILHRRTALVKSDAERDAMLGAARARWKAAPGDESAALEVAQLLAAFEFRREALDLLLDAARRIPSSEKIEKTALELFDRLRDERGREVFLADRLRASPDRQDLALARTRSLFLLNRRSEALAVFDSLAAKLDPAAHLTQLLELARFLRRNTLPADAAAIFERAVALVPARLDVRRELAETWLVLGEKSKARAVFTGPLPADTETENLLDVIQFLLKQELFAEAQAALAAKVVREPQNFDLRLMQLTVAARLADQAGGVKLVEATRALADTDARYRRWLEAAVAFHQVFETDEAFLAEQQERAAAEPDAWTRAKLDRTLAFVEVAMGHGRKADIAAMLEAALAGKVAPDVRVELRRRQFALIESDPAQTAAAEKQLQALITDDPVRADEYRVRLAMLYSRLKRADQAVQILGGGADGREMLAAIDLKKINDAALLGGLENVVREFGGAGRKQVEILERLTALEPANRGAWERWLTALAGTGDEERLRFSLRRLRAGIDKLPLAEEVRALLGDHLLASHWRSLHLLLREAEKDDARMGETLPMLDAAERVAQERDAWLWIAWTRAYTLNRLGRGEARDAAIRELDRVAALPPAKPQPKSVGDDAAAPEEKEPAAEGIAFPDGLVIGMEEARTLLTAPPTKVPTASASLAEGPRGALHARWAFDTDQQALITKVLPLDTAHVLVLDATGRLYCVDAVTGKLRWARDGARPALPQRDENGNFYGGIEVASLAVPVVDGARIFLPVGDQIECWSADDGHRLWRAPALRSAASATPVQPSLFIHAGRLLVCDPVASAIAALDPATGKLLWQRDYPRSASMTPQHALNTGASLSDGKLLCYGSGAVIVNADDGALLWAFDASRVKEFPIALHDASAASATPFAPPTPMGYRGRYFGRSAYGSYGSYGRGYPAQSMQLDYLQRAQFDGNSFGALQPGARLTLAHSAAAWAGGSMDSGQLRFGLLAGARLVLFTNQMMRTVRLDLPFSGGSTRSDGAFIGLAGKRACLLNSGSLSIFDLDSCTVSHIPIAEATADAAPDLHTQASPIPVEAAVDAGLIYVSGPGGIAIYHGRTGERLQKAAWPAGVVSSQVTAPLGEMVSYLPQGRFRNSNTGRGQSSETIAAVVSGGVFYTPVSGSRLVALAGEEKDRAK